MRVYLRHARRCDDVTPLDWHTYYRVYSNLATLIWHVLYHAIIGLTFNNYTRAPYSSARLYVL